MTKPFKFRKADIASMEHRFSQLVPEFSEHECQASARDLASQLEAHPEIAVCFRGCAWEAVDQEISDWDRWAREASAK